MINVLTILKNEFDRLNIPYTFDGWESEVELPHFVGEISQVPTYDEDGKLEYKFILNGFSTNHTTLFDVAEMLRKEYQHSRIINGIVIKYDNANIVNSGVDGLKNLQITLSIKEWSV